MLIMYYEYNIYHKKVTIALKMYCLGPYSIAAWHLQKEHLHFNFAK